MTTEEKLLRRARDEDRGEASETAMDEDRGEDSETGYG